MYQAPNYQQYRTARRLVHSCCNYDCGNCLLLDDGEECVCPQSITYSLVCHWFRAAVLTLQQDDGIIVKIVFLQLEIVIFAIVSHRQFSPLHGFRVSHIHWCATGFVPPFFPWTLACTPPPALVGLYGLGVQRHVQHDRVHFFRSQRSLRLTPNASFPA